MSSPPNPFARRTRNIARRDYNALNNGDDSPTPGPWSDETEVNNPVESILESPLESFRTMASNGPSMLEPSSPIPIPSSPPSTEVASSLPAQGASSPPAPSKKRKAKSHTSWTSEHFWVTELEATWRRKGGPLKKDRLLMCKRCDWSSTDSARSGSTTNLGTHLQTKHRIKPGSDTAPPMVKTSLDRFMAPQKDKVSLEDAMVHWAIDTRQPFTAVEQLSFRKMFDSAGIINVPIKTADTLRNRIKDQYQRYRDSVKQELNTTCHTVALSLDLWTSENQLSILGVMGHWLTADFEKKEKLLEFMEIEGVHSGENLSEVLVMMLEELGIASKLLTITGDNAGNNGTLCEFLQTSLLKKYDDEDHEFRMKPLMRFHGRGSFIPCLAHVINLVCKEFLSSLKAGSVKEAKAMLDEIATERNNHFTGVHSTKGTIVKIRLLVLWIARSPQRRQEWKAVSPAKQVGYDVDTRWNSTYTMICDALRLRRELGEFIRSRPEVSALQLADEEWLTLQQVAKILKPFWDHTNTVSTTCPSIIESLPIYWNLDDLLDDVKNSKGDFTNVSREVQAAAGKAIRKLDKFTKKMDDNLLHYVACILDPRIKTKFIAAQMSQSDAQHIIGEVRSFLKKEYPFEAPVSTRSERPSGMSETMWKTLCRVQEPSEGGITSDIDKYLDSPPVSWSHQLIEDGDSEWVLKWWKANTFQYPLMAQAVRDYLPVPSAEVGIERVFSGGRDVLGLRRQSMSAETMRWLMLLKGVNNGNS
jgi:hAT family C-terminal dimerisation region/Domain of unknown function (DUF4413)